MKKSSMIFRMICMAVCIALCLSVIPVMAEQAAEAEDTVAEEAVEVAEKEAATEETVTEETVDEKTATGETEENTAEDVIKEATEEETEEAVDLLTAAMRDGGVYITPGIENNAVFDYEGVRYKIAASEGNMIKVDGFESNFGVESSIPANAKNRLQANGEITTDAAHSGYFGLSALSGDVIYRTAVTGDRIYAFSAWLKMPANGSIADDGRAFYVTGETGKTYVVGYNEIGRETAQTGKWQQVLFTFKAPQTGVFEIKFKYSGKTPLYIDDIELYEAEVFENPLDIVSIVCTDENGAYDYSTGFSSRNLTHTTTLYNSDEDDVFFNAIMILYRNDIMVDFEIINECALVLDETEVTFEIEIPEEGELNEYRYMVYFISDTRPTHFYGKVPNRLNPYEVSGN